MLANNLTLDDEQAVQEELKELQALAASSPSDYCSNISVDTPLGSRGWAKGPKHRTRSYQDSR